MLKKTSYSSKVQNYVLFCFFKDSTSGVCSVTSTLKLCKLTIPPPNSIIGKSICYEKVITWTRSGKSERHGKVTLYLSPKSEMHHRKVEVVSAQETPLVWKGLVRERNSSHATTPFNCLADLILLSMQAACSVQTMHPEPPEIRRQFPISKLKWGLRYTVVKH
jgi:hypothetical protein